MTLSRTFGLRISTAERKMLAAIADRLQRSQSDAVRLLIREAARELVYEGNCDTQPERTREVQNAAQ